MHIWKENVTSRDISFKLLMNMIVAMNVLLSLHVLPQIINLYVSFLCVQ